VGGAFVYVFLYFYIHTHAHTHTHTHTRPPAHLADARHPGDEHLAEELVLHGDLGEEVVDLVALPVRPAAPALSDDVGEHKAGLCGGGGERESCESTHSQAK